MTELGVQLQASVVILVVVLPDTEWRLGQLILCCVDTIVRIPNTTLGWVSFPSG